VVRTDIGAWGILIEEDGYVPEISRIQAIEGAEILVWFAPDGPMTEHLARSRAAENKLFVVAAASASVGGSLIASPDGAVLSQAFVGEDQMISALCPLCLSREKSVVPGTDVLLDRSPEDNIFRNR
jgi:predicted amidohydrolase